MLHVREQALNEQGPGGGGMLQAEWLTSEEKEGW